jgi:hypothetical protein
MALMALVESYLPASTLSASLQAAKSPLDA